MLIPEEIDALYVETFNLDLAALDSTARVALPDDASKAGLLELRDSRGVLLCHIPRDASPAMADIACRLHGDALLKGIRVGEEGAWAKLRALIGAAPAGPAI